MSTPQPTAVCKDSVVEIHYELTNPEGEVLDSTEGIEPLAYLHGHQNIIVGLENALLGKGPGDKFTVTVAPHEAYGELDENLMQQVAREQFGDTPLKVGMRFRAETDHGELSVVVREVTDENVIVDANHPLAGVPLTFKVEIMSVRPATKVELEHGHIHSAGGCGHHHEHDHEHDHG